MIGMRCRMTIKKILRAQEIAMRQRIPIIDEVDDRNALPHGDLLGAQDFLDRLRPPGTGFDSCVVRDDHHRAILDATQPGHDAGGRRLPIVLIPRDQQADLDPGTVAIEQRGDPFARRQLALIVLALDALRPAPLLEARAQLLVLFGEGLETTHAATCSAAHSSMYLMRSDVGVPGPNSLPVPCVSSALMSSGGMMPPPVSSTSWRPAASSNLRTLGNSVMCAPDKIDRPTTSTSS